MTKEQLRAETDRSWSATGDDLGGGAAARVLSPCIQVCVLDADQVCTGCRRTIGEIAGWAAMTPDEKRRVLAELPGRRTGDGA